MRFLLLLFALPALLNAASLHLTISPSTILPNPSLLPPSTHATLTTTGIVLSAPIHRSNGFSFHNISAGSYLCDIYSRDYVFAPLRVDVGEEGQVEVWQTFRGNEWDNKGERVGAGSGVVEVKVVGHKGFYEIREGFSPLNYLKNPMILIGMLGMVMVFGMPYLLENMDPEMKKEFEEQQTKSPLAGGVSAANPLQNFDMAGWMAGQTAKSSSADEGGGSRARRRG